jgi:hypothetical protein
MSLVRHFGARGDGKTDDTAALSHAVQQGDGHLVFERGDYLLSRPLYIPLEQFGRIGIDGQGGTARLIMTGPGPALYLVGTHRKNAEPSSFVPGVWQKERMPLVHGLEIIGQHEEADGIRVEGVMQATLQNLLIRRCRHGVHLTGRDRNVLIADSHIYDNRGVGVFLDRVNLHQINIDGNHISYCKRGGLVVEGSEVRNIQVCGNDIEYNYDLQAKTSADILFDGRAGTVREGTIVGNTIQAVPSPQGANVRLLGAGADNPNAVGMLTITGNLIGSQDTLLHLQACRGVTVTGNALYSGLRHAVYAEDAEHLVFGANSIDHNSDYRGKATDRLVFRNCRNVTLSGVLLQHTREPEGEPQESIELHGCQNVNVTGCQVINARVRGISVVNSKVVRIADCTIRGRAGDRTYRTPIRVIQGSQHVLISTNFLGRGNEGEWSLPDDVGAAEGNREID